MRFSVFNLRKHRNEKVALPHVGSFSLPDIRYYKVDDLTKYEGILDMVNIVGYDILIKPQNIEVKAFANSSVQLGESNYPFVLTHLQDITLFSCYYLEPYRPSYYCFNMNNEGSIYEHIGIIADMLNGEEKVFLQAMIKKSSQGWNDLISDYNSYRKGVQNPSKILRPIQHKLIETFEKLSGESYRNPKMESFHEKVTQQPYSMVIRLIVEGTQDKKRRTYIANRVKALFSKINQDNAISLNISENNTESFITDCQLKRFPLLRGKGHLFCSNEIMPMIRYKVNQIIVTHTEPSTKITPVRLSFKLPRLDLLPKSHVSGNLDNDMHKHEETINKTLEQIGLLKQGKIKVVNVQQGATIKRITFTLPKGLNYSHFNEKVCKDIKSHLGNNVSVMMGDLPNSTAICLPVEKRQKVFLRDLIETEQFKQFTNDNPLPMVIGVDEVGKIIIACLTKLPHLLGAGATGSGKSVWLNSVLLTFLLTKTPDEISVIIIDPKQVEFLQYKNFPHVQDIVTDTRKVLPLLASLTEEMTRRYSLFAELGCRNIKQYNAKAPEPLKYIVCMIDEFSELAMAVPDVKESVTRLGQLARACGINLVVATQRPSVNIVDGDIKAQLPARVVFKCSSMHDYKTVLDHKPPYELLGKGDGACFGILDTLTRFQSPLIADGEEETDKVIQDVLNEWRAILGGREIKQDVLPVIEEKPIPSDLERAKFHICEGGKVTTRELQKALNVSNEKVKQILNELVNDNWLQQPTNSRSGYQVIISEEEKESFGNWFAKTFAPLKS